MSETNRFELGIYMYSACNSMNNLSSYCGLVDAKIRDYDKNLPVKHWFAEQTLFNYLYVDCRM